jgi:DNA mismatch repair protein MutS2
MKTVRDIMQESAGFRFLINEISFVSSPGRKLLYNRQMMTQADEIRQQLDLLEQMHILVQIPENNDPMNRIIHDLSGLKDIQLTISRLSSGEIADDIELFEIKQLALLNESIKAILKEIHCDLIRLPDLENVVGLLDPENQGIPHFYIYNAYSEALRELRLKIKQADLSSTEVLETLRLQELELEEEIRISLSQKLRVFADGLKVALEELSLLDVLIASAKWSIEMSLCKPEISDKDTQYETLFNPAVKLFLTETGKEYQPVDIHFDKAPVLITGANMGGKTVLLQTVFISQYLCQFGLFVPAKKAMISPVEAVYFNSEENRTSQNGLSSFAEEMVQLNEMVKAVRSGKKVLALLDELARTTNPDEGKAIVSSTLEFLAEQKTSGLITTHYSGIRVECRKLRVRGLIHEKLTEKIHLKDLNRYMDYRLEEAAMNEAPAEGIRIAEILGMDEEIIRKAKLHYTGKKP